MSETVRVEGDSAPDGVMPSPIDRLFRKCQNCEKASAVLAKLNSELARVVLRGTVLDESCDEDLTRKNQRLYGPFSVECYRCRGTGVELTARGQRLIAFVKQFLESADVNWLTTVDDTFPF